MKAISRDAEKIGGKQRLSDRMNKIGEICMKMELSEKTPVRLFGAFAKPRGSKEKIASAPETLISRTNFDETMKEGTDGIR